MLFRSIILVASLTLNVIANGQPAWRVDKLGVGEGLSQGLVYAIHQDKKGFIWIGTHGGLNRYDGYRFKVFQYSPFDSTTLGDNAVFFLKEDRATGKFWIGGSSALNEFDPVTFVNTRYRYTKKQVEFADGIFINPQEMLLAGEYAVLLFNTRKKTFEEIPVYDEGKNPVTISRVENVAADQKGNFMIMSRTGIFFYDSTSRSCKRKTTDSPDFLAFHDLEIFNVLQDSRGYYWISTNKNGLIRFDSSTGKSLAIALPSPLKNETTRFDVVVEDSQGKLWAGSAKGLLRIDPQTLRVDHFSSDNSSEVSLSHNEINAITEDRNHFLWIGTVGGGINKLIPRSAGFKNFSLVKNTTGTPTGSYIMAMEQMNKDIWFTNIWDQVGRINMETGQTEVLSKPPLPKEYSWYTEGTIVKRKENELSVLNSEFDYRIIQGPGGELSVQPHASPGLSYIYYAKNGKVWHMVKAPVEKIFARNDTIYGNTFFYDAKEDDAENIWIGTSTGLLRFRSGQKLFTQYKHVDNNKNSISSNLIYALEIDDNDQNIWMAAYNGGLCAFNKASGTFRYYSQEEGLSDNTVYSLEKDHHGNIWFSSNAGISAYDAKNKTFRNYSVADGLLNHEFNRRSSFKNEQGWLFFGGVSGIDYFHPDSIFRNDIHSSLAFTGFRVFNRDYIPGVEQAIPKIELKPDDRHVAIEFASLDYDDQQKIQYAYRINDSEWIKTGNQNILSFSDLTTGRHPLFVRSTNSDGIWLDNEIGCLIIVHPWWWETWWFRIAIVLLSSGVIVVSIRVYYHRKLEKQKNILERQQAVEKERTRIATDMHDDLGANLSRIKFLSETIGIKKQRQETIDVEVGSIRDYAHEMIDKMGEIVWALNEKNDSLNDLLSYTRSYAVEYLSQHGIQCHVQTQEPPSDLFVSGEFRRNVYLTVKEALHNIVKHSQATRVDIQVETGRNLSIIIHDNGKGFDENHRRPQGSGISNMKKRIAILHGELQLETNAGTTITLRVPLP